MFFYPLKIVGFNFRFRIKTSVVYFLYQTLPKKLSETSHQATILNSKNVWKFMKIKLYKDVSTVYCQVSKYEIVHFCSKKVHCTTLSSKITMFLQGSFPPTSYLDSFLNGLFNLLIHCAPKSEIIVQFGKIKIQKQKVHLRYIYCKEW